MRAVSPRLVLALSLVLLLLAGCSQDHDPLAPEAPVTYYDLKTAPAGYYDSVDFSTQAALRATLHAVIDDHIKIPYTSTATDTWNVLELADQDPNDAGRILDVYLNASYPKYGEGNTDYNREHTWPKSYGFPNDNSSNYPYTDCHHLFLCNDSYNTSRSNKPFRNGSGASSEKPTEVNDGLGGGTGVYPGNSNWTEGSFTEGLWETWIGRRGDVARALLYMDVRYEGGVHGVSGVSEPDLILTDNESLIAASNTGGNESTAYMGMLSVLLQWHAQDPVDDRERARNDAVYTYQGNRNPFIDNPAWVDCLYAAAPSASQTMRFGTPPNPVALMPGTNAPTVGLTWNPSINHTTFMPNAVTDVLALTGSGTNVNIPLGALGTMLCDLSTPSILLVNGPGVPFSVPITTCRVAGLSLCAQGISVDSGGAVRFTNALDVTVGL